MDYLTGVQTGVQTPAVARGSTRPAAHGRLLWDTAIMFVQTVVYLFFHRAPAHRRPPTRSITLHTTDNRTRHSTHSRAPRQLIYISQLLRPDVQTEPLSYWGRAQHRHHAVVDTGFSASFSSPCCPYRRLFRASIESVLPKATPSRPNHAGMTAIHRGGQCHARRKVQQLLGPPADNRF